MSLSNQQGRLPTVPKPPHHYIRCCHKNVRVQISNFLAGLYLQRCLALASHWLVLFFFPPRELTFQRSQPLCERILTRGAEAITLLLGNDLHATLLAFRDRVKLNGVDDARERKDEDSRILFIALVEGKLLRPQNGPDALPLPYSPFALQ